MNSDGAEFSACAGVTDEHEHLRSIKKLWLGLLRQAIKDLKNRNSLVKRKAENYISNKNNYGIGSFIWICDFLQINPANARRKINKTNFNELDFVTAERAADLLGISKSSVYMFFSGISKMVRTGAEKLSMLFPDKSVAEWQNTTTGALLDALSVMNKRHKETGNPKGIK